MICNNIMEALDFSTAVEPNDKGKVGDFVKKIVIPHIVVPIVKDVLLK